MKTFEELQSKNPKVKMLYELLQNLYAQLKQLVIQNANHINEMILITSDIKMLLLDIRKQAEVRITEIEKQKKDGTYKLIQKEKANKKKMFH